MLQRSTDDATWEKLHIKENRDMSLFSQSFWTSESALPGAQEGQEWQLMSAVFHF